MTGRVLFVDDDQMLLSSMDRCLGLKFDLDTAISGPEALRKIDESGPYPVIVSDMRMPVMDGIQFIERAREVSPHTIFMMLTGNQDVQTAVRAVNEGRVYRFLNKPCDPSDIAAAIEHAGRQYELETSERELLDQTFLGAMGILTDVMETLSPDLVGRAARVEQFLCELCMLAEFSPRWEYKMAAKLSLVGASIHPVPANLPATSERAIASYHKACQTGGKMIERVPRLSLVGKIIAQSGTVEGDFLYDQPRGEADVVEVGASLLRLANLVESMSYLGIDIEQAMADIQKMLPDLRPNLVSATHEAYPVDEPANYVVIDVGDLVEGMVLHGNLVRGDGSTLLRAGRRLSQTHIEKLCTEKKTYGDFPAVEITQGSFEAAYPDHARQAT